MERQNGGQWSFLILRVIIGIGFMAHGWAKISRGTMGFEKLLDQTGVPLAHLSSWLVPLIELAGGLALVLGLFVSVASVPLIATMLVAMFTVQIHYGYSSVKTIGLTAQGPVFGPPGYEINLLYIAGLLTLMVNGGGRYVLDRFLFRGRRAGKYGADHG
jgi:putative oxidoreductase